MIRQPVSQTQLRVELASRLPFETDIMICQSQAIVRLLSQPWFAGRPSRPDIVRFCEPPVTNAATGAALPLTLPSQGQWLLRVLARDGRFVIGEYRRQMKAIGHLGTLDRLFGASATTRNWNTITAIAKVLER